MERVSLPNMPAKRAQDYASGTGLYARVIYTPTESKPDRRVIEAQAFQVDENGIFVQAPEGYPSRTHGTSHTISVTGLGDTHTILPGWIRLHGTFNPNELMEGMTIEEELPTAPAFGTLVYVEPYGYRYDAGILEGILSGKAEELFKLVSQSEILSDFTL